MTAITEPGSATVAGERRSLSQVVAGLPRYTPLLLLAVAWEVTTRAGLVPESALPSLASVLAAWWGLAASGELWINGVS